MFELLTDENDAITILETDHNDLKDLFERFEESESRREKMEIAAEAIHILKVHAAIEEEIFYPSVRRAAVEKNIMNEAEVEHHVAKVLIAELEKESSRDQFDAKFKVLAESVRHHIKEEEGKMFPEARKTEVDMERLGKKLIARREELSRKGVPPSPEEKMVSGKKTKTPSKTRKGRTDSGERIMA